jgi:hypothetical protein
MTHLTIRWTQAWPIGGSYRVSYTYYNGCAGCTQDKYGDRQRGQWLGVAALDANDRPIGGHVRMTG